MRLSIADRVPSGRAAPSPYDPRVSRRLALLTITAAQTLSVASASVVAVALPDLGRDLNASASEQQWVVDAFVIVFASLLVAGGVLGDRRGRRTTFLAGLTLFASGSLWCAVAPDVATLLAGRVVQGFGPALVLPASLAMVGAVFPQPRERARAIGIWATGSGIGLASGPTVGGILVEVFGWRAVFGVNVPLAILLIVAGLRSLPRITPVPARHPFDVGGAVLLTGGIAALCFTIIEGRGLGWTSAPILAAGAGTVAAFIAFLAWERTRPEPLVDPALLRQPTFAAANLAGAVVFFALIGATVYFSAFFQQVQGRGALETGFCMLPLGLAVMVCAPVSGRLTGRIGPRVPMLTGLFAAAIATLGMLRLDPALGYGAVWWNVALLGVGAGTALPPMTVTAIATVAPARTGMASAVHNASRQVGQTLGVAVLGAIIAAHAGTSADGGRRLVGAAAEDWVAGLHTALVVAALLIMVTGVAVAVLLARGEALARPAVRAPGATVEP